MTNFVLPWFTTEQKWDMGWKWTHQKSGDLLTELTLCTRFYVINSFFGNDACLATYPEESPIWQDDKIISGSWRTQPFCILMIDHSLFSQKTGEFLESFLFIYDILRVRYKKSSINFDLPTIFIRLFCTKIGDFFNTQFHAIRISGNEKNH